MSLPDFRALDAALLGTSFVPHYAVEPVPTLHFRAIWLPPEIADLVAEIAAAHAQGRPVGPPAGLRYRKGSYLDLHQGPGLRWEILLNGPEAGTLKIRDLREGFEIPLLETVEDRRSIAGMFGEVGDAAAPDLVG